MAKKSYLYGILSIIILSALLFIRVPEVGENQETHNQNSGDIIGDGFVGQTFAASRNYLSSIGIIIATHSGRENTHHVIFHLKNSAESQTDIQTITVSPQQFGDNQFYDFAFKPISDSKGKIFFFSLTSPESVIDNAVAVDISTKDPYPSGVAYVRGSGRQNIDLAFRTSYNVPLATHLVHSIKSFFSTPILPLWYWAALPIVLYIGFAWWVMQSRHTKQTWIILLALTITGFIIRYFYARSLPYTFDEGNYSYDAWTALHGHLAGGDGYVKAPLVIAWIALWEAILGHTAMAGRISSIIAGSTLVYPIYLLTTTIWNQKAGLLSAGLWAVMGSAVVSTIYVHTQSVAIFFGVSGLALLAYSLALPLTKGESEGVRLRLLVGAGAVMGMAVASRKSMLGLGLTVLLLLFALSRTWKSRAQHTLYVGIGFLLVLAIFFGFAYGVYDTEGVVEAIGINSASDGISSVEVSQIEQVRAYSLKGMTPFFRESLPLIVLSLLGLGFSLKKKFLWIIPLAIYWWAWDFFSQYEGEGFMKFGIPTLWWLFGVLLLFSATLRTPTISPLARGRARDSAPFQGEAGWGVWVARALLGPIWVGSLTFFYMNWIKFHANYIAEFIPPLAVMGGVGIYYYVESTKQIKNKFIKIILLTAFIGIAGWSATVSNFITYLYEHTGTFTQTAANEAAQWAKDNIPANQEIFTGAALIPYLSGHHTSLDIAHPRWYAYEFTRTNPKRLETFLPSAKDMVQAFHNANWLLLDSQTGFSFLMEYSEIEKGIEADWQQLKGIENGSNTLTFYKRVK